MVFDAIADGEVQSELNDKLNTNDRVIFAKVPFEQCPYYYDTWHHILKHPQTKLIWVHRQNPLHMLISGLNAYQQNQWQVNLDQEPKVDQVTIHVDHLREYLAFYSAHTTFFKLLLDQRPNALTISYDSLSTNWDKASTRISDFLGLAERRIDLTIKRQVLLHLNIVSNRQEIESLLRNTEWEWCLDD
jgi:LPS sulfotransferase NodH